MREILFRAKRADNGAWVEDAFCMKDCDDPFGKMLDRPSIIKYDPPCDGFWYRVNQETVGQFTGLNDKNGKKIFEGDILSNHYFAEPDEEWDDLYVVEMVGGAWVATLVEDGTLSTEYVPDNLLLYSYADSEIIGNIHDNPELLEKGGT